MKFRQSGGSKTQRWLSPFLAVLLASPLSIFAEQQPVAPAETQSPMESLKLIALAGNNRMNDLERRVMTPLVVQVLDQNGKPVEGAQVVFRFPLKGPSAEFPGHLPAQTVRSNADGQAAANGWMANREAGTFQVRVTATFGNQLGETTITMSNVTRIVGDGEVQHRKKWWSSKWGKIGIVAGAAGVAAAVVLLTRGGGGASNTTITAAPGTPTIGAPH